MSGAQSTATIQKHLDSEKYEVYLIDIRKVPAHLNHFDIFIW